MLDKLIEIIREAGKRSLSYFDSDQNIKAEFKNPMDIVTIADLEIEKYLIDNRVLEDVDDSSFGGSA